jgi:hypothetical protein
MECDASATLTSPTAADPICTLERMRIFHDADVQVQRGMLQRQMLSNENGRISLDWWEGNNRNEYSVEEDDEN